MFSNQIIREPSWAGLNPGMPSWEPTAHNDAVLICDQTGLKGQVFAMTFGEKTSQYMYRMEQNSGDHILIKFIEPERRKAGEQAESIARWLKAQNISVATPLAGYPKILPDGRLVVVMPFLEGRRIEPTVTDICRLGGALAKLHEILLNHADRSSWEQNTSERLLNLETIRDDICRNNVKYGPNPEDVLALAKDRNLDFIQGAQSIRPVHGDLNPGNVLLINNQVTFFDFEDVSHSVLAPEFELMLVLERFVLVRTENDNDAILLGQAFLKGYFEEQNIGPKQIHFDPVLVLRSLALRSLMTLALGERSGTVISDDEWQKFFMLERLAVLRKHVLHEIISITYGQRT